MRPLRPCRAKFLTIVGTFSESSSRWLSEHIPGLAVSRLPGPDFTRYRQIMAMLNCWNSMPIIDGVGDTMVVDPMALKPALGSITLLDVIDDGRDSDAACTAVGLRQSAGAASPASI
jgi:hypothetical protein